MPKKFKVAAILIIGLAFLFWLFFDRSKHIPALVAANTFGSDPFDAVGSFAIQLAPFSGLLALWRVFGASRRDVPVRFPNTRGGAEHLYLTLRGEMVTLLAIVVTLAADAVAMVGGLALAAILAGGWVLHSAAQAHMPTSPRPWMRAAIICLASGVILALYPPQWDQGNGGGILTALLGMALLFFNVWALATALFPDPLAGYADLLDDLAGLYAWLKRRAGFAAVIFSFCEKWAQQSWLRRLADWLNPRRHGWNIPILLGLGLGAGAFLGEALGEGGFPAARKFLLVISVFIGIEVAGVLLGYALLAPFLGLFRRETS
jgi:hypothetical protein